MHEPLWSHGTDLPNYPPLEQDAQCDVCVVGAGIAGVSTAYRLAAGGKRVVLLERGGLASGETHHTSAHLASAQDDRFVEIERVHGEAGARQAAESHAAAIEWIEEVSREEGIACDFRRVPGHLFLGPDDEPDLLDRELAAARRAGLTAERLARAPLPSFDLGPCLTFANQARFHPLKFVSGLARALESHGAHIHGGTRVVDVDDTRSKGPRRVRTAGRNGEDGPVVTADAVVLATNAPAAHYLVTMKMVPYRTFIVTLRLTADVPDALYWDTADPYHYVRLAEDGEGPLLIVGGGDYQAGTKDEGEQRLQALERWTRERFPVGEVAYRWSGQVFEPADYMGFIGEAQTESRVYIATGDSGQGLTHGVIAALLIGDLILERENPWESLYSPGRVSARAAREYAEDAAKVGFRYAEWLRPGEVRSEEDVERGHGAILRSGIQPVAVYRDSDGVIHRRSAVCTHAGCIVHWNSTAEEWNCPCHGSRFSPKGDLLNGPATRPLADANSTDT